MRYQSGTPAATRNARQKANRRIVSRGANRVDPMNAEIIATAIEVTRKVWRRRFSTLNMKAQMTPIAAAKINIENWKRSEFVRA